MEPLELAEPLLLPHLQGTLVQGWHTGMRDDIIQHLQVFFAVHTVLASSRFVRYQ